MSDDTESTGRAWPVLLAMLMFGIGSQIVQALLIRESLVVFYGNEVSLGAFFGGWLFWVAIGSLWVVRRPASALVRRPRPALGWLTLALPVLVLGQLIALRCVRWLFDIPSVELVPLGDLALSLLLLTLPSGVLLGLAFPLACKAAREAPAAPGTAVRGVSALYLIEALGALLGGVLFTFVLVQWLGVWRSLGVLMLAAPLVAWPLSRGARVQRGAAVLLGMLGLLALSPLESAWHGWMEHVRFSALQPGLELLDAVETRYGHTAFGRVGGQISVVADGRIEASFPQREAAAQTAAFVYAQAAGAERVLMLGGLAGGLATELLRYPLVSLDLVEQDREAFRRLQPWLPEPDRSALTDSRLHLHHDDGRRYLNRLSGAGLDLVLALDAVPTSAHGNRYFTREFYRRVKDNLSPRGVFCTRVASASNYLGASVSSYTGSVFRTLAAVFPYVAVLPGDEHLYCAAPAADRVSEDAAVLAQRYRPLEAAAGGFPAMSFYSLLPLDRIRQLREQLGAETGPLNTDARPVTYYQNMLLWGHFTASGFVQGLERLRRMGAGSYLAPLLVFVALWLLRAGMGGFSPPRLRRQSAAFALGILGFVAMAAQMMLLFGFQARVGFMFERIALLNALFMAGLALGTGLVGRRLAASPRRELCLAGLLVAVAALVIGLPMTLQAVGGLDLSLQEAAFLLLAGFFGVVTGAGFPLGVYQAHADFGEVSASGGLSEAADSFGGALGGLLTGALLVPLMGMEGTARLLAWICLLAVLPVLCARFRPSGWEALRRRAEQAFGWKSLGWGLAFVALVLFAWQLLQRGSEPGPRLAFDQSVLAEVSGSSHFKTLEPGFHLGWNGAATDAPADTAVLSSLLAAPQVRGYAGPLNLLVAVDRAGVLRGVRYVESDETPAYVAGIGTWLASLTGRDLSVRGLDLRQVDALSGATLSSAAALAAINRSVRLAGDKGFDRRFAAGEAAAAASPWVSARFWLTLGLLGAFFPVYLSGSERGRLGFQLAALVILGFGLNSLVTEVDLVNLSLGNAASPADNPQRWLLLGFVLVSGVLFGQVWCGYLCPFGALQEFVSRLGRRLGLRTYPRRPLETRVRFLKYLLLAVCLSLVWLSGEVAWVSFNPMQHFFSWRVQGVMGLLGVLVLVASLFHYRFWCRYFCPFGAFAALFNKLALLQHKGPQRRFEHCDLGVREAFDIDCIRCHRCLSGADTRVKSRPAGGARHASPNDC